MRTLLAMAGVVLTASACNLTGPSESVASNWAAIGPNPRGGSVGLILRQNGDTITGTACALDFNFVVYRDVPVFGEYPEVSFNAPGGSQFRGRLDSTKDIAGEYGTFALRFKRTDGNPCP